MLGKNLDIIGNKLLISSQYLNVGLDRHSPVTAQYYGNTEEQFTNEVLASYVHTMIDLDSPLESCALSCYLTNNCHFFSSPDVNTCYLGNFYEIKNIFSNINTQFHILTNVYGKN